MLQGRPDIAEHLFSKAPEAKSKEDRKNILETCYRVGKLSLSSGEYETAAKWLGRALDSSDMLSRQPDLDSKDVRLLILHAVGNWSPVKGTSNLANMAQFKQILISTRLIRETSCPEFRKH